MKREYICVMNRLKGTNEPFGMEKGYPTDTMGYDEAMKYATEFMNESSKLFKKLEYKIEVKEW